MNIDLKLIGLAGAVFLQGCATASFAPPSVNVTSLVKREGVPNCDFSQVAHSSKNQVLPIWHNPKGTLVLINNFVDVYRCAIQKAADGRQYFEVPAFLAAVGGVAASAFGAGKNVPIATGTAVSLLGGAKTYYAPKDKAHLLDSAYDALLCVKTEAVGIRAFNIVDSQTGTATGGFDKPVTAAEADTTGGNGDNSSGDAVSFTPARRYYEMVSAALFQIERVFASRLRDVGKYDAEGVVAQIEALQKAVDTAKTAEKDQMVDGAGKKSDDAGASAAMAALSVSPFNKTLAANVSRNTSLKLDVLQPRLQQCVVRAKL